MLTKLYTKGWLLKEDLKDDARGVSALEYAILIAIVVGLGIALFTSEAFKDIFTNAETSLEGVKEATEDNKP